MRTKRDPEYNREMSLRYRTAHPDRYAIYHLRTTLRMPKKLGMDLRNVTEQMIQEVEQEGEA